VLFAQHDLADFAQGGFGQRPTPRRMAITGERQVSFRHTRICATHGVWRTTGTIARHLA
jgi:hypothetical protein